ncbi:hypothetical protein LshimejAT787_0601580 [Lyophyllum shimeji]|uniref:Uncharacterized protein n=1 Tax=Lyophyllum shimeji TaxID=47721 RepID=A0A9P3UQ89_LYOSH|nr:hypothetical protein LshimejAT787_0601580 [Lyophyllum shimeji]
MAPSPPALVSQEVPGCSTGHPPITQGLLRHNLQHIPSKSVPLTICCIYQPIERLGWQLSRQARYPARPRASSGYNFAAILRSIKCFQSSVPLAGHPRPVLIIGGEEL